MPLLHMLMQNGHAPIPNSLTNIADSLWSFFCYVAPIYLISCKWWLGMARENWFQLAQFINIICLYALQSLYLCLCFHLPCKTKMLHSCERQSVQTTTEESRGWPGQAQIVPKGKTAMSISSVISCFLLSNFLFTYTAGNLKCVCQTRAAQYIENLSS